MPQLGHTAAMWHAVGVSLKPVGRPLYSFQTRATVPTWLHVDPSNIWQTLPCNKSPQPPLMREMQCWWNQIYVFWGTQSSQTTRYVLLVFPSSSMLKCKPFSVSKTPLSPKRFWSRLFPTSKCPHSSAYIRTISYSFGEKPELDIPRVRDVQLWRHQHQRFAAKPFPRPLLYKPLPQPLIWSSTLHTQLCVHTTFWTLQLISRVLAALVMWAPG